MVLSYDDISTTKRQSDLCMHNFKTETSTCIDLAVAPRVSSFINGIGQKDNHRLMEPYTDRQIQELPWDWTVVS